jgi:hypothetical protein
MVNKILTAAGIKYRRGRFTANAPDTYAVYRDDWDAGGPDDRPLVIRHDITVELYESKPDDKAEASIEKAIGEAGLHYTKQDRYWLSTEQLYQVIYEFTYYEKRRA